MSQDASNQIPQRAVPIAPPLVRCLKAAADKLYAAAEAHRAAQQERQELVAVICEIYKTNSIDEISGVAMVPENSDGAK